MNPTIYLRKTKNLEDITNIQDYSLFYESPNEYIDRMKTQSITPELKRDINFHLKQLMEISVDTQLLYQWVRLNDTQSKINFFKQLLLKDNLFELLFYRRYHFSDLDFYDLPEKLQQSLMLSYKEFFEERYEYLIETVNNSAKYLKLDSNNPTTEKMDDAINSIINQGLNMNLGIISKAYSIPRIISYKGKICNNYRFIDAEVMHYDKLNNLLYKIYDFETFLSDVSHNSLDYYIKIWELFGSSERKNKNAKYSSMTQEELISTFYKVYNGVPSNFLEILKNFDYQDKRILSNNYHLEEHNRLVINYLVQETESSDFPLLEHLFQKKNLRSYNDDNYSCKKIEKFKQFLKSFQ